MKLRNIYKSCSAWIRQAAANRQKRIRRSGVPRGISFERLTRIVREQTGDSLLNVSYSHISGWKDAGAYRLFLRTRQGTVWRMIFKNVILDRQQNPALTGFPFTPGLPEYTIYTQPQPGLAAYLPKVYFAERVHDKRYRYLLEDLDRDYHRNLDPKAILTAVLELPGLHDSMKVWSFGENEDRLISYDSDARPDLLDYVEENLESYLLRTNLPVGRKLLERWPQISDLYRYPDFQNYAMPNPIHGDFSTSNILFHKRFPDRIKIVDWEWAGIGIPHADLATLLKAMPPEIEQRALKLYSELEDQLPFYEHRQLYQWCKLERGLIDAAFIAAQQMYSGVRATFNLEYFIASGLNRAWQAYRDLTYTRISDSLK